MASTAFLFWRTVVASTHAHSRSRSPYNITVRYGQTGRRRISETQIEGILYDIIYYHYYVCVPYYYYYYYFVSVVDPSASGSGDAVFSASTVHMCCTQSSLLLLLLDDNNNRDPQVATGYDCSIWAHALISDLYLLLYYFIAPRSVHTRRGRRRRRRVSDFRAQVSLCV